MKKFFHAVALLCSLVHFQHEGGSHPHHAAHELDILFSDLISRRAIVR